MKLGKILVLTLALASLAACGQAPVTPDAESSQGEDAPPAQVLTETAPEETPEEGHGPVAEPQMTEGYGQGGYCGNTITRITGGGETWSFWGDDSVELTDLLLYLDYSEGTCRCMPEYSVETEFSEESYGVSLTGAYVRHGNKQCPLTEEQVEYIRGVIEENCVPEQAE